MPHASMLHCSPPAFPEDILYHLFEHDCLDSTLPQAALVCRQWARPAQAALYKDLVFSAMGTQRRDSHLARTMRTTPHLRRYVRRLRLVTLWTYSPAPELCDWIRMLPPHCLCEFQWVWSSGHINPALIQCQAINTVSRLQLKGRIYTADRLQLVLDLPSLQSLALELTGHETGDLSIPERSRLKHLDLRLSIGYGPIFDKLLAVTGPLLQSLRLACKMGFDDEEDHLLVAAIESHCAPTLKRIDLSVTSVLDNPVPILDSLVQWYPILEHLRCGEDTYSHRLFEHLPPTLKTLELSFDNELPPHTMTLLHFVSLKRPNVDKLSSLVFITDGDPERFPDVAELCRAKGIGFAVRSIDDQN